MPSRRVTASVVVITLGLLSAVIVNIATNPDITVPGLSVGYDIVVEGNYAYVSNNDGVVVIDKSNHHAPIRVTHIQVDDGAFGLDLVDGLLYIGSEQEGLVIADVSNPLNPVVIGTHLTGSIYSLFVNESYAYVALANGNLQLVDVTNSSNPSNLSMLDIGSSGNDVAVVGDIAYFADSYNGLVLVNVSDPLAPAVIRTLTNTDGAWDICIYETTLYLGCHNQGVRIFDISSPAQPELLGSFNDGGEVYGVSGDGECLVLADLQEGAELLNVTDPENPVEIAQYSDAAPHSVYYDGIYAYLADQDKEFILVDFEGDTPSGILVRSPGMEWLWAIPVGLVLAGISVLVVPRLRGNRQSI